MAAGSTYSTIATTTLASAAASYTFSSIPSTYTDLIVVMNGQIASGGNDSVLYQFNGDTATNYSGTSIYGTGSGTGSDRATNTANYVAGRMSSAANSTSIFQVQNYANTTTYKTSLARASVPDAIVLAYVGLWRSTAAINSIKLYTASAVNFNVGTTFTLYGILAA